MYSTFGILVVLAQQNALSSDSVQRQLSAAKVRQAKPGTEPVQLADGGGLLLYISTNGSRSWRYRYRLGSKQQILTIGSFPEISLEQARVAHRAARWLVERGTHPLAFVEKESSAKQAEQDAARLHTFRALSDEWQQATNAGLSPRTAKHRKQMLDSHVIPTLGDRPIVEITRKELRDLLLGLDKDTPVTAKHCRQYVKQIFDWALDAEVIQGNPTPKANSLPNQSSRKVIPRKALPLSQLGSFLLKIEDASASDPLTKAALWLLILTWSRTAEVVGARWEEFDLERGLWEIPAERMKSREKHSVFLSNQALKRLQGLQQISDGEYLFPNRRKPKAHMSRMTLSAWRKRWGFDGVMEIHGLHAVASTWANATGRFRPDVIEAALAHRERDRVRAAYNRADFAQDRKLMLQAWADECDRLFCVAQNKKNEASRKEQPVSVAAALNSPRGARMADGSS